MFRESAFQSTQKLIVFALMMTPASILAADSYGIPEIPAQENSGFLKNPPPAWTERFKLCDRFLQVDWIDKQNRIGLSAHDVFSDADKPAKKETSLVLVSDVNPSHRIVEIGHIGDLIRPRRFQNVADHIRELTQRIKRGPVRVAPDGNTLTIENEELNLRIGQEDPTETLALHTQNVCIVYPTQDLAWLVEIKWPGRIESKGKNEERFSQLKAGLDSVDSRTLEKIGLFFLARARSLDFNGDGVDDYLMPRLGVVYSWGGKFFVMETERVHSDEATDLYTFPPRGDTCAVYAPGASYIQVTTDGSNVYWFGKCNLTRLTHQ